MTLIRADFFPTFCLRIISAFQIIGGRLCSAHFLSAFIPREIGFSAFSFQIKITRRLIILTGNQPFDQFSPDEYFGQIFRQENLGKFF